MKRQEKPLPVSLPMKRATKNSTLRHATIIGAGLTGCFLALLMAKRGYKVDIYEKSSEEELLGTASKKSFNLTFYGYAVLALKKIGLWEKILPTLITLKGSVTQVGPQGKKVYFSFSEDEMKYYTIKRSEMLHVFIKELTKNSNITIQFSTKVVAIDRHLKNLVMETPKGSIGAFYSILFGTDGAHSAVRSFLQLGQETNHLLTYASWNYKQITLPPEIVKKLSLQENTQYAWTRKYASIIAFPTTQKSFAAICMLPNNEKHNFSTLSTKKAIYRFLKENFPELEFALDIIVKNFRDNPVGNFITVQTNPWYYQDSIVLLGDAAHAVLPFYGVGMSVGFGDCLYLEQLMNKHSDDWEKILPRYQQQRKPNTDILAKLCKESLTRFTRYKLGDYLSIYDKIESLLHKILPRFVLPPLFQLVVDDPDNILELYKKYQHQRKIMNAFGVSLGVSILVMLLTVYERFQKIPKR